MTDVISSLSNKVFVRIDRGEEILEQLKKLCEAEQITLAVWQDGQNLLLDTPQIMNGKLQVPDAPGLGVHLNMERVMQANALYNSLPSHDRDDAMAMQYLIPNWKYDHKKPCLVR